MANEPTRTKRRRSRNSPGAEISCIDSQHSCGDHRHDRDVAGFPHHAPGDIRSRQGFIPFLEFKDLFHAAGIRNEDEFVYGLLTREFRSISLIPRAKTTDHDADFVFNNQVVKVVRNTKDVNLSELAVDDED